MAVAWRTDPHSPPWAPPAQRAAPGAWCWPPAAHRWCARDVNALIADWAGVRGWVPTDPHTAIGLLGAMLAWHGDLSVRPAALEMAREAAELAAARARITAQLAQREHNAAARAAGRAAPGRARAGRGPPGRGRGACPRSRPAHPGRRRRDRRPRRRDPRRPRTTPHLNQPPHLPFPDPPTSTLSPLPTRPLPRGPWPSRPAARHPPRHTNRLPKTPLNTSGTLAQECAIASGVIVGDVPVSAVRP